ncbi:MAG: hypothetical protein JXA77_15900 [Bacteroidales bacterium]|nr:hypothetical protein [Bacteroidales bacterium]MBN2817468.1 hypothetical protein [Bacteroidales bacterium]
MVAQGKYENFKVSVYTRAYEVQKMQDINWLDSTWNIISSQLAVDKIYLETHRDLLIVDPETLTKAKKFFEEKGVEVAGGITYTIDERNLFETFCYTNPEHRKKAKEIIEYSAENFDEVILDDFFFTSCKCNLCVEAKGDKSWSEYRLNLMTEAAENLIMKPAKAINPDVKVIIKYPNWYEHFHELGFNLQTEPEIFDGIYTGTETRDAVMSNQHLQAYLSYLVFRYYNNLKSGKNGGGWVDTGGMKYYDRYAEQLWLTILAKAPEMTLFDYRQMLYPLKDEWQALWKDEETSFNYSNFLPIEKDATMAVTASHALNSIDEIAGKLGNPYGIKSYKPYHSNGEDFLQNYFGMIGIPMDLVPEFPMDDEMIILTEQAKHDQEIVTKIDQRLRNGKDIIITSGLLDALQDRGIRNIVNLEYTTRKTLAKDFLIRGTIIEGNTEILFPQIQYFTNDSWEIISAMDAGLGWPVLHQGKYANATLYVLTIPENFADLYHLPVEVLNTLRENICKNQDLILEGPSKVSLFLYDNNTFVVESFNNETVKVKIVMKEKTEALKDISTQEEIESEVRPEVKFWGKVYAPEKYVYNLKISPHSFRAFQIVK